MIANPIPKEYSMDKRLIDSAIDKAIGEAEEKGIRGKNLTPFLLKRITEITGGLSLEANLKLVYNNAKIAAQIAGKLSDILRMEN